MKKINMRDKNNNEHHIDKLFSAKLSGLEGTPSANAWQTLEKNLSQKAGKKNKVVIWLPYAAVAAVALLVVSIWLLRQQMPGDIQTNSQLADGTKVELKDGQEKPASQQQVTPDTKETIAQLPDTKQKEGQIAIQQPITKSETPENTTVQPEKSIVKNTNKKEVKIKQVTPPMPDEVKQPRIIKPSMDALENSVAQIEKQPALITPAALAKVTKEETMTIVVTVNLNEEGETLAEEDGSEESEATRQAGKQSKAGKFFSTLKKIKKGEFDELGIKPETIVAYVKDRAASTNQSNEK
jgi:hypothetical protein